MIPKTIHYCWFGGKPLPKKFLHYLETWRHHMPNYRIIEWNENNITTRSDYLKQNLDEQNWSFASDYVRFFSLFEQGGYYLDTDVELLQPLPGQDSSAVLGFENVLDRVSKNPVGSAILGFGPAHPFCFEIIKALDRNPGARPLVTDIMTRNMRKKGLLKLRHHPVDFEFVEIAGIRVYHSDILYPEMRNRFSCRNSLPARTRAIHHVAGSWGGSRLDPLPWWRRFYDYRLDRKILRPVEKVIKGCFGKS
jgi:hypothetical protein